MVPSYFYLAKFPKWKSRLLFLKITAILKSMWILNPMLLMMVCITRRIYHVLAFYKFDYDNFKYVDIIIYLVISD